MDDSLGVSEVVMIPFMKREVLQQICAILDTDNTWETIAPYMPGIELRDVEGCKRYSSYNQSPSELLLRIWSSKGYSTTHLYQLFAKTKLIRLMRMMRSQVHEKYHYLENKVTNSTSRVSKQMVQPPGSQSASRLKKTEIKESSPSPAAAAASQLSRSNTDDTLRVAIEGTLPVTYCELLEATNGFAVSNVIGKGGYGTVYKGELKGTGGIVAVKRLHSGNDTSQNGSRERLRQSLTELRTLARFRHDNILPIYAYSLEGSEPCLVYQFMSNGSLEDRLLCRVRSEKILK